MRPGSLLLIVVAASLVLSGSAIASPPPDASTTRFTAQKLAVIEDNLLACLTSGYPGSRASAALAVRELKQVAPEYGFNRLIIPLMQIVKDENCDVASRITASLALHAIQSGRGDYAIKMTARFTEVERIKRICENLVYARMVEKTVSD